MAVTLFMHQEYGQIGINRKSCRFELRRTPADFDLNQTSSSINLTLRPGQVSIDMAEMNNSLGYGSVEFITRSLVAEARQIYESDLVRTVQTGDAFVRLHSPVSVGELAARIKYFDNPLPEIGLEYIAPPEIHYEPGEISYEVVPGQINMDVRPGRVEMLNYEPAEVKVYLEQAPVLEITTKGWAFDLRV